MREGQLIDLLRSVRDRGPSTMRSLVQAVEGPICSTFGSAACAFELYRPGALYLSRKIAGIDNNGLSAMFGIRPERIKEWIVVDPDGERRIGPASEMTVASLPFFHGGAEAGRLYLLAGKGRDEALKGRSAELLSELISLMVRPCMMRRDPAGAAGGESLRVELLEASNDESLMRGLLGEMMTGTGAELCAYMNRREGGTLFLMAESRNLYGIFPEIRDKLRTSLRMFTNGQSGDWIAREKVYYRAGDPEAPSYSGGGMESYFLVPVAAGTVVEGVLLLGSVRRDAFVRETISRYRVLAGEGGPESAECRDDDSAGMLEKLLLSIPYGAAIVDSEGNITGVNDALHSLLGSGGRLPRTIEEIGEFSLFDIRAAWEEFTRFGRNITDRRVDSSRGSGRSVSLSLIRMENLPGEARSILVVRDTTEATGMELKRDEAMAVVAHEIRTPMTALKNSLRIMIDAESGRECVEESGVEGPGRRFFETALRTVDRLSVLVDGLLDASMVRRSGDDPKIERVKVRSFLEDSSLLFSNSMAKKEISFSIEADEGASDIYIDKGMMEQVIQNLLSNSLKHVPVGGEISISAEPMDGPPDWIGSVLPAKHVYEPRFIVIRITDSGPGIPHDVAESINVPFTSGPDRIRPSKGIGLYIAARLVKLHGGLFVVETGETGSSISIVLPSDMETSRTMRTVIDIQSAVESLVSTGASPILYVLTRDGGECWLDIAGRMRDRPMINPAASETGRTGVCFWPVGEDFAIAMTAERKYREYPMSLFGGGREGLRVVEEYGDGFPDIGWAACPDDGRDYSSLFNAAMDRKNDGAGGPFRKGEKAWTVTGFSS